MDGWMDGRVHVHCIALCMQPLTASWWRANGLVASASTLAARFHHRHHLYTSSLWAA
jgi:hypothetical protein